MATLIPSLDSCARRMTSGKHRLARRLAQKLEEAYLLWYDLPVGPKQTLPDFVLLHPRRGALILETKDWRLDTIRKVTGDGNRVIHGVAGSGKTMILGCRAEYLARACAASSKPILILCFNEPLGVKLHSVMQAKGLGDRVHVRHFHKWCRDQLKTDNLLPTETMGTGPLMEAFVLRVIQGVDQKHIPSGQYQAILIDEGHDCAAAWLKLLTQMVAPTTNSLLLYDDAQSIFERARSKNFSFKSVGVQAQGRTTILKINYRNTRQILQTANLVAADLLTADDDKDDDGIPLVKPISCGRDGQAPVIIQLPTLRDEAYAIADHLASAHQEGHAWGDMAVLRADWKTMDLCASALTQRKLPHRLRKKSGDYQPGADAIQVMTMKVSKGLEFPVVALPGVGHMPAAGEDEKDAARVFYVAATRATQRLVMGVGGDGEFGKRLV